MTQTNKWFQGQGAYLTSMPPGFELASRLELPSTPNLPTKIVPAKIRRPQIFREVPYGHENSTP